MHFKFNSDSFSSIFEASKVEEGGMAALRVLELLTGFWIAPRILELLPKSPLKRVLLNRKLKKMVCYPFFTVFIQIFAGKNRKFKSK